jgi:hypothetical protein
MTNTTTTTELAAGITKEARRGFREVLDSTGDEMLAAEAAEMIDAAWDEIEA